MEQHEYSSTCLCPVCDARFKMHNHIPLEKAKTLTHGDIVHQNRGKNSDGTCIRWRVNGQVQQWKRNPNRVRIPIKHGLYNYGYITEDNLDALHLPENCPNPKK